MAALSLRCLPEAAQGLLTVWQEGRRPENPTLMDKASFVTAEAEGALNKSLDSGHRFIELYGGFQRILGQRLVEDSAGYPVALLDDGMLTFIADTGGATTENEVSFDTVTANARALSAFFNQLAAEGVPLLFLQAPSKVDGQDKGLPTGVYDWNNELADRFLALLAEEDIPFLDTRAALREAGDFHSFFFRTDHHWTPEGGFVAFRALCRRLRDDYGMDIAPEITDPARYLTTVYKDWFLGSQGKRVGTLYAGVDDISLIQPDFSTHLTYEVPVFGILREGGYYQSILFPERVEQKDYYNENPYALYAGGDYFLSHVYNHENPAGPKILLIRDSFACAVTPFLSLACSQLDLIDPRFYHESILAYVKETRPDIVLFLYSPGSDNLPNLFAFEG